MAQYTMFTGKKAIITFFTFLTCLLLLNNTEIKAGESIFDDLLGVSFPNEKDGWICGRAGMILHSEDGGENWHRQESNTDYTLTAIDFVNTENGWAVGDGGEILHTTNGGVNWLKQQSPSSSYLKDIFALTPSIAWICTGNGEILHTADGGMNWKIQYQGDRFKLNSLSFYSDKIGWAAGEHGFIYRTTDGGNSWLQKGGTYEFTEYDELLTGNLIFDVEAVNEKTAWTVGIDGVVTMTDDGGESWKVVETGAIKTQLFTITSNKKNILIIAGEGEFIASNDRGATWSREKLHPSIEYGWIYDIDHITDEKYIAVGWEGAIYRNDKFELRESWTK